MAIPAVGVSDFLGFWKINNDVYQNTYFQEYLDQWQDRLIRQIISVDAYVEIDSNGIASKQKWQDLFDGVASYFNSDCDKKLFQEGVKRALKGLLYFIYVRDRMFDPTNSGNVQPLQEASNRSNNVHNGTIAAQRWNNAITVLYDQILPFVREYESLTQTITSSTDNTGTYTVFVDSTFYLSDGEDVSINGVDYIVSNLVVDVSFDINEATSGLDFTGDLAKYEPYKDFPLCYSLHDELQNIFL